MNKNIVLALVLSVFLVACQGGGSPEQDMTTPFVGGNAALNMYLQNGIPPPTVFDGGSQPFSIGAVVENIGEYDIQPDDYMEIRIEGLLWSNFGLSSSDDLVEVSDALIRGAHKNFDGTILPGDIYNYIFEGLNFEPNLQGNQLHTFRVVACYDYENYATTTLCFKDDIVENVQDSTICTLTGPKPVANSGGPLHVTEVVQNPMNDNRIQVNLKIEHVGTGEFYSLEDTDPQCNPSPRNQQKSKVLMTVTTDSASSSNIECYRLQGNSGVLTMYQGSPQVVTCIIEGSDAGSRIYQESLNVELRYRYGEFIEDSFIVQAVPSES